MSKKFKDMTREERVADSERPRRISWTALDSTVLAVAREGYAGDWACYIRAVKGDCHEIEVEDVIAHGSKASQKLAEFLFSNFKDLRYRW